MGRSGGRPWAVSKRVPLLGSRLHGQGGRLAIVKQVELVALAPRASSTLHVNVPIIAGFGAFIITRCSTCLSTTLPSNAFVTDQQ
jgi:hypothetical protein